MLTVLLPPALILNASAILFHASMFDDALSFSVEADRVIFRGFVFQIFLYEEAEEEELLSEIQTIPKRPPKHPQTTRAWQSS